MAITAQELNVILSARDKQFTKAMERAQRRVEKFSAKSQKDLSRTTKAVNALSVAANRIGPAFAFTAVTAGLSNILSAGTATYTITTDDARLEPVLTLPIQAGVFTLTGQSAGVAQTLVVEGVQLYTLTGSDTYFDAGRARRFEYANVANAASLTETQPNSVILVDPNNEAA